MSRPTPADYNRVFAAADALLDKLSANGAEDEHELFLIDQGQKPPRDGKRAFTSSEYYQALTLLLRLGLVERRDRPSPV
ncbi:MAG: hypothetical protein ACREJO_13505 [Phycisphaerales bacterium]